jgi:ABC-type Fe3+ transport system substrate-binding protein
VLKIPPKMIDTRYRSIVHGGSAIASAAYNRELISAEQVPNTWEGFLKPEFKGRKFLVDIRPINFAPFAAALGEEWLVNYARRIKEQEPVWVRGHTRAITAMVGGEYGLYQLTNYHSCVRAQQQDPRKVLVCKLIEPIPVRLSVQQAIINNAPRPYGAILFLEFLASPEAQKILDDIEPLKSSIYAPDSELEKATRGRKVAVMDTFEHTDRWVKKAVEGFGFPRAEKLKK